MTLTDLPFLIVLLALAVASAVCSATETALFGLSAGDRQRLRRLNAAALQSAERLLAKPRLLLITVLVISTVISVAYVVVASLMGTSRSSATADVVLRLATLVFLIVFCEILPKVFAAARRVELVSYIARPAEIVFRAVAPPVAALDRLVFSPLARLVHPTAAVDGRPLTADELAALVEVGAEEGTLDQQEEDLLTSVLEMSTTRVREVMIPRVDVAWVPDTAGRAQVVEALSKGVRACIPVCHGSIDQGVVGLLDAESYLAACDRGGHDLPVRSAMTPPRAVPQNAKLDQLIEFFRARRLHTALCVDEYGQVTGLVEIESALRKLLIAQDDLTQGQASGVTRLAPGRFLVPGRLGVRHWEELFESDDLGRLTVDKKVSTIAGLMIARLGRLPKVGTSMRVGNVRLTVEEMDGRTIRAVRVELEDAAGEAA